MRRVPKLILAGLSLAMLMATPALSASVYWTFSNSTTYTIRIKLFQDDYNYVWPSSTRSHELPPGGTITVPAGSVVAGSQVCYGAFTEDNDNVYWGGGRYNNEVSPSLNCITPHSGKNTTSSSLGY